MLQEKNNFTYVYRRYITFLALSPLINMIVKDWMRVKIEEERDVMLKQARIIRLLALCGGFMILSTIVVAFGSFFFGQTLRLITNLTDQDTGKPMLIQSYYLHDVSSSPKYELTYLIQIIGLTTSGLSYTAVDNFLGLLILHICGQMENLHLRLLNLGKDPNYFKVILKYNVKDHIRLIRFWKCSWVFMELPELIFSLNSLKESITKVWFDKNKTRCTILL